MGNPSHKTETSELCPAFHHFCYNKDSLQNAKLSGLSTLYIEEKQQDWETETEKTLDDFVKSWLNSGHTPEN